MHTKESNFGKADAYYAWLIALIVSLTYIWFAKFHFDIHHDGLMLSGIDALMSGKRLFIDEFQFYGVGSTYFNFFVAEILGFKLLYIRYVYALLYGYIYFLTYFIARKGGLTRDNAVLLSAVLFSYTYFFLDTPVYYLSIWPGVICLALALSLVAVEVYSKSVYKTPVIAVLIIAMLLTKINYGALYIIAHFVAVLTLKRAKLLYEISIFFVIGSIIFALSLAYDYPLDEYFDQAVLAPLSFTRHNQFTEQPEGFIGSVLSSLFLMKGHGGVDYVLHFIPLLNLAGYLIYYKKYSDTCKIIAIYGFFSWFLYYPIPGLIHIYLSLPLILVSSSIGLSAIFCNSQKNVPLAKYILPTVLLIFVTYQCLFLTTRRLLNKIPEYRREYVLHETEDVLEGLRIDKGTAATLEKLTELIGSSDKTTFINLTNSGFYNILAKTSGKNTYSLAPYNYLWEWGNIGDTRYYSRLQYLLSNNARANLVLSAIPFPLKGYRIVDILKPPGSAGWKFTQDFPQELFLNIGIQEPAQEIRIKAKLLDSVNIPDTSWRPCPAKNCLLRLSLPSQISIDEVYVALHDPSKLLFHDFSKHEIAILEMECPNIRKQFININVTSAAYDDFNSCISASTLRDKDKFYYSNLADASNTKNSIRITGVGNNILGDGRVFGYDETVKGPFSVTYNHPLNELYILVPTEFDSYSGILSITSGERTYFGIFQVK